MSTDVSTSAVTPLAHGHRVHGPSALGGDRGRFWALTFTLARTEFKLRFFGSALGYLWQLVRPLMLFTVLYVFFTKVAQVNKQHAPGQEHYGAQLLGSIILFTFFIEATSGAIRSVVDRENLVRKIQFPRMAIPLSVVLLAMFNLGLNLIVVFVFMTIEGVYPMLSWLELPLLIGLLMVLATGVAMLLSALFVTFRDIQPIWEVICQILMYASPVIISIETVLAAFKSHEHKFLLHHHYLLQVYMLNPLAVIFQQFRHAMITPATPSAGQVIGSWMGLGGALAIVLAIFIAGFVVFNRSARRIAENL
ncbi:MAG TPA: ABC transporter permease [Solirubrobacteraceae bacterium]|jgi:ABC-2 type transport system permease protein